MNGFKRRPVSGQSMTETALLLPLYLLIVFSLLQMGQLATALVVTNYAASAIARQAVQEGSITNQGAYETRFGALITAGMKNEKVFPVLDPATSAPLRNVHVHACAEISAFPFVGQFFGSILANGLGSGSSDRCPDLGTRAFAFKNTPPVASFVVHGTATARMNYQP